MWDLKALGLSLVMNIGGFGLFFEPEGRPLGRRAEDPPPELVVGASAVSLAWSLPGSELLMLESLS